MRRAASSRQPRPIINPTIWSTCPNVPVPQDGLPGMGPCGPEGLHMAVMHSGITLAPLAGELVAAGVLDQPLSNHQRDLIAPYAPQRFQS